MKKVAKKGWCITAAVMAVSVIVCIFCFVRWERKSSDLSFQFEETTYTYQDEYYDVFKLVYLQMVGSRDKEKERKINQLLEDLSFLTSALAASRDSIFSNISASFNRML